MPFAPDRIAIVGATGLVGRALVAELLSEGRGRPRLFGRAQGEVAGCPVEPLQLVPDAFAGLDAVVHLAAITTIHADEVTLQRVNVDMAVQTAQAAVAAGVRRFVFLSSIAVHGRTSEAEIGPETPMRPINGYGRSKMEAERRLTDLARQTGLELQILRPPMVYGRGGSGSFAALARLVHSGLPLPLAAAQGARTFCSVGNLVSAIRHALNTDEPNGILLPGDPADVAVPQLVRRMANSEGKRERLFYAPRRLVAFLASLVGRHEIVSSLFDPMCVDRSHWARRGWRPVESGEVAMQAALRADTAGPPKLILYITNSTPYFFSHRIAVAREALARGFRAALAGGDVGAHISQLKAEDILPVQLPVLSRGIDPFGDLKAAWSIGAWIRSEAPAIVQASGLKTILLCALARLRTPLPRVVCIVTGLGTTYINHSLKARLMRRAIETIIGPLLRREQTQVVFQNADDYGYFLKRGLIRPETALIVPGSGVDISEFTPRPEPDGEPVVMFPARLLKSKGVLEFARAAAHIRRRGIAARFALVGDLDPDNPDALSGAELAELIEKGDVEFWGFRDDMAAVFAACHLVCLPSYREGLPKALIEAASAGRPIVTTDVPGCRQVVTHGHNGLLVPVRDPEALAEAIMELLNDVPRRREMGAAGRVRAEAEFALQVVVARTADLYGQPGVCDQLRALSTGPQDAR